MTRENAVALLGISAAASWEVAKGRFWGLVNPIYAHFSPPLSKSEEGQLSKMIVPLFEALELLFPHEVENEGIFQKIQEVIEPSKSTLNNNLNDTSPMRNKKFDSTLNYGSLYYEWSPWTKFFLRCSGANLKILSHAECISDLNKFIGMGIMVFFTGLFASFSGMYCAYSVFESNWFAILIGLLWGCWVFCLDWFILSTTSRFSIFQAVPRFLLACIIALVIARPVEMVIVWDKLKSTYNEVKLAHAETVKKKIMNETMVKEKIESINRASNSADIIITKLQAQIDSLNISIRREIEGKNGNGPSCKGICDDMKAERETLNNRKQKEEGNLDSLIAQKNTIFQQVEDKYSKLKLPEEPDLSSQLEALDILTDKNKTIRYMVWFITLFFMLLECIPILLKLITSEGIYETKVRFLKTKEQLNLEREILAMQQEQDLDSHILQAIHEEFKNRIIEAEKGFLASKLKARRSELEDDIDYWGRNILKRAFN